MIRKASRSIQLITKLLHTIASLGIVLATLALFPGVTPVLATSGQELFSNHCAGCHVNGGNIIRRGRTLKLTALKKNGLDDPDTIARVAREGIGQMSGYGDVLGVGGDELVAAWIWEQAQNAWIQG